MTARHRHDRYVMTLEWDRNDLVYRVAGPELPGCQIPETTRVETVKQGGNAIETWLDGAHAWDWPVPEPKPRDRNGPNPLARETRTNGVN